MVNDKEKWVKQFVWLAKVVTLFGVIIFIFLKIKDQPEIASKLLPEIWEVAKNNPAVLIFVTLLMPLNWLLEALKWKYLTEPIQAIKLTEALKGVLSGLSIAFITPHGIGDYIGRIAMIRSDSRTKLVGALFLGRTMQLLATLLFGMVGVYFLLGFYSLMIIFGLFFTGFLTLLFLTRLKVKLKFKWLDTFIYYFDIISAYNFIFLLKIFLLSSLRYFVFASQFIIILSLFLTTSLLQNIGGATWILLAKSVLPTFNFLSDLGIREVSAIYFYEKIDVEILPVISASLLVWIINILVPTLVGLVFIFQLKYRSE